MSEKKAALLVAAIAGALLAVATIILFGGMRPYDEDAILQQIAREDSALCTKLAFTAATQGSDQCVAELADLRQRHDRLRITYGWL